MYFVLQVRPLPYMAFVSSAHRVHRSKTKCNGTRPTCSLCEKRGSECRYLKDSGLQPESNPMNHINQTENNPHTRQASSDGRHRVNILFSEQDSHSSNSNVSNAVDGTPLTSLGTIGDSGLQSLGQTTSIGRPTLYQEQYPSLDGAHYFASGDDADWLGNASIGDGPLLEPFIPGLWDFSLTSPPQALQLSLQLPQEPEVEEIPPEEDGTSNESSTGSDFEHPWPMEWNPGSTKPWSLPMLENPQHPKKAARRTFCTKAITPSDVATLKDRIKSEYDYGPRQQIQLENFPSSESLNHAIDMYFIHLHGVRNDLVTHGSCKADSIRYCQWSIIQPLILNKTLLLHFV